MNAFCFYRRNELVPNSEEKGGVATCMPWPASTATTSLQKEGPETRGCLSMGLTEDMK